jgi:hypothetical protein
MFAENVQILLLDVLRVVYQHLAIIVEILYYFNCIQLDLIGNADAKTINI